MSMKIASATLMLISVLSVRSALSQQSDKSTGEAQQTTLQEDSGAQSSQRSEQSGPSENHNSGSKKHKTKNKEREKEEGEAVGSGLDLAARQLGLDSILTNLDSRMST
jgi:hypothetical protein